MEAVVDSLITLVNDFKDADGVDGGINDIIDVNGGVKWGDPGLVTIDEYPYFYVEPQRTAPKSSTLSRAGYDVMNLYVQICFVTNASDYFDPHVDEVPASRQVTQVGEALWKWLKRFSNLHLDDPAVRNVEIGAVDYVPQDRDGVYTRIAVINLTVEKQYQHRD